ncbi:hypothetical protein RBB83_13135 [Paenibacillus peoriae]
MSLLAYHAFIVVRDGKLEMIEKPSDANHKVAFELINYGKRGFIGDLEVS